jgi:phosphoglycolate phosphatase-like HAD superfamily hydrolase
MFRRVVKLVLFDIDGTLIRTGGAGVRAFERTFAEVFGLPNATKTLRFSGRTDVSLVRECFHQHEIDPSESNFRRFFDNYPAFLEQLLHISVGGVCDGIHSFLDSLRALPHPPLLGLLTGNIRRGAELKLRYYHLWDRFQTGAFADDHEDRNCIAAVAKARGEEALKRQLSGEEILVIGDTPHDITCGQSIGARVLAVGTGEFTAAQLQSLNPTWSMKDLTQVNPESVLS